MRAELDRAKVAGYLVQPMVDPRIKMLIGVVNDPNDPLGGAGGLEEASPDVIAYGSRTGRRVRAGSTQEGPGLSPWPTR